MTKDLPLSFHVLARVSNKGLSLIDSIVVVVLGVLFLHYSESMTTLAAFYLGYRRICSVELSPAGGWIADKIGMNRVFNISIACVIVGLIVISLGLIGTGVVIVFSLNQVDSYFVDHVSHPKDYSLFKVVVGLILAIVSVR